MITRAASTSATAGLANFAISTIETVAGFLFSVLSLVVPVLVLIHLFAVVAGMYYASRRVLRTLFSAWRDDRAGL